MSLSRRQFLVRTSVVGGGLALGFTLPGCSSSPIPNARPEAVQPNAWIQITPQNEIIFQLDKAEMGQGVYSSLATVVAEELEVAPEAINVEMAGAHVKFRNPAMQAQLTGGSTSISTTWEPLRMAAASTRELMVNAAAEAWQVPASQCRAENGAVIKQGSDERLVYGELVDIARKLPVPDAPALKKPQDFKYLGKSRTKMDAAAKSTGTATFGIDVDIPGALAAVVVRCPHFGGKLLNVDDSAVKAAKGVKDVFPIHSGVAIVADTYWQARKAAGSLKVEWDKGPLANVSSDSVLKRREGLVETGERNTIESRGDVKTAFNEASDVVSLRFDSPYFHHSTMEPQNCTAHVVDGRAELWVPNQGPDVVQGIVNEYTGIPFEAITVHNTFLGGGFGRRCFPDFAAEAAVISQKLGKPVKVVWSREDDMQHDFYRPATYHQVKATVTADGKIDAWDHTLISPSIVRGYAVWLAAAAMPRWIPPKVGRAIGRMGSNLLEGTGYDPTMSEGAVIPYHSGNFNLDVVYDDPGVPIGFWRSVGHSHNAFVVESMVSALATKAGKDGVAFRRDNLQPGSRHLATLNLVAEKANWGNAPEGVYQGVSVHESFGSVAAHVVEVVKQPDGGMKLQRIVSAIHCGMALDPRNVKLQVQSSVVYGLTAALKAPITLKEGAVVQSNFTMHP